MHKIVYIACILLIIIYGLFGNKWEEFDNINTYSRFCDSFTKKTFEDISKYDIYGFPGKETPRLKQIYQLYTQKFTDCPAKISVVNAAKLIMANQFHYILDCRTKEERNTGYLPNSIFIGAMHNRSNATKNIKNMLNIGLSEFILVYSSNGEKAFYSANNIKQYGKYQNVYFVYDGGYYQLKEQLSITHKIDTTKCRENYKHLTLCSY